MQPSEAPSWAIPTPDWLKRRLMPNEYIVYKVRWHWFYWVLAFIPLISLTLISPWVIFDLPYKTVALIILALIVFCCVVHGFGDKKRPTTWAFAHFLITLASIIGGGIFFFAYLEYEFSVIYLILSASIGCQLVRFLWHYIPYLITHIYITNTPDIRPRILFRESLVAQDVQIFEGGKNLYFSENQTVIGRVLGFEHASFRVGGEDKNLPAYLIPPQHFSAAIQGRLAELFPQTPRTALLTGEEVVTDNQGEFVSALEPSITDAGFEENIDHSQDE